MKEKTLTVLSRATLYAPIILVSAVIIVYLALAKKFQLKHWQIICLASVLVLMAVFVVAFVCLDISIGLGSDLYEIDYSREDEERREAELLDYEGELEYFEEEDNEIRSEKSPAFESGIIEFDPKEGKTQKSAGTEDSKSLHDSVATNGEQEVPARDVFGSESSKEVSSVREGADTNSSADVRKTLSVEETKVANADTLLSRSTSFVQESEDPQMADANVVADNARGLMNKSDRAHVYSGTNAAEVSPIQRTATVSDAADIALVQKTAAVLDAENVMLEEAERSLTTASAESKTVRVAEVRGAKSVAVTAKGAEVMSDQSTSFVSISYGSRLESAIGARGKQPIVSIATDADVVSEQSSSSVREDASQKIYTSGGKIPRIRDSDDEEILRSVNLSAVVKRGGARTGTASVLPREKHAFSFHRKEASATQCSAAIGMMRAVVIELPQGEERQYNDLMKLVEVTSRKKPSYYYEFKFSRPQSDWYLLKKVASVKGIKVEPGKKVYISLSETSALREENFLNMERKFEDAGTIRILFPKNKDPFVRITYCKNQRDSILSKIYTGYFLKGDPRGDEFFQKYVSLLDAGITGHYDDVQEGIRKIMFRAKFAISSEPSRAYQKQIDKERSSYESPITEQLAISMAFDIVNNPSVFDGVVQSWSETKLKPEDNRAEAISFLNEFVRRSSKFSQQVPYYYGAPTAGFIKFLLSTMSSPIKLPEFFVQGPNLEDVMVLNRNYLLACLNIEQGKIFADALEKKGNKQGTCLHIFALFFSDKFPLLKNMLKQDINNLCIASFLLTAGERGELPGQSSRIFRGAFLNAFTYFSACETVRYSIREAIYKTYRVSSGSAGDALKTGDDAWGITGEEQAAFAKDLEELAFGQRLPELLNFLNGKVVLENCGESTLFGVLQKLSKRAIEDIATNAIWNKGCKERLVDVDFPFKADRAVFYDTDRPHTVVTNNALEVQAQGAPSSIKAIRF